MQTRLSVSITEAAVLTGKSERWLQRLIAKGEIAAESISGAVGQGGISYSIPLEALPAEAQLKYYAAQDAWDGSADGTADIIAYRERYGEDGLNELLERQRAIMIIRAICATDSSKLRPQIDALAAEMNVSARTVYRWVTAYEAEGLKGLMRKGRSDKGESRAMCLEARRYVWEMYLTPQRRTGEGALAKLREYAETMGTEACENCPYRDGSRNRDALLGTDDIQHFPVCGQAGSGIIAPESRYSINRAIAQLTDEEKTYMRRGRKAWEAEHMYKITRKKPDLINLCWFGDHHQLDAWFADADGKPVRPWLTLWYDIGTGYPIGKALVLTPNSQSIAESFVRAVADKKGSSVWGAPVYVYTDNGRDYRAERFEGGSIVEYNLGDLNDGVGTKTIYQMLGVSVVHAKAYHGWAKPVERWFRTLEDKYMREYATYCGNSPENRPENFDKTLKAITERGELPTMDELYDVLNNKIIPAYINTPHDGYGGETPADRYGQLPRARDEHYAWSMLAMCKEEHKDNCLITPSGIRFKNRLYWDAELMHRAKEKVRVLYNRDCLDSITICTMPGANGKISRFICEAVPKDTLEYVGEDEEKLARYCAISKVQERQLRRGLAAKGIAPCTGGYLHRIGYMIYAMSTPATMTDWVWETLSHSFCLCPTLTACAANIRCSRSH